MSLRCGNGMTFPTAAPQGRGKDLGHQPSSHTTATPEWQAAALQRLQPKPPAAVIRPQRHSCFLPSVLLLVSATPPADLLPQSWGCMWAPSPRLGHVTLGALLCLISPKVGPAVEGPTGRGTQPLPADFPPPPSLWCLCKAVGAGIVEDAGFRRRVGRKSPWTAAPTPAIPNPAQEEGTSLFSFEEPTPRPQEPDSLSPPF